MFTLCAAQNGGRKKGGREINGAIMGSTLITWKIAVRQGCQVLRDQGAHNNKDIQK